MSDSRNKGKMASIVVAQVEPPELKLPWGAWRAAVSEVDSKVRDLFSTGSSLILNMEIDTSQIYVLKNIRFGSKPVRFAAPSFPDWEDDSLQNITSGTTCIQIDTTKLRNPPGGRDRLGDPNKAARTLKLTDQSEDCLFLDIYVPVSAFQSEAESLPVIVWIYGGAYAFGSKDQDTILYRGDAVVKSSGYKAIFVVGNYRVGAFGWLAGSYMEEVAQPNAGLYDQALLFQWVQEHIGKVKGDKSQISVWGESAGAGSILHHLIREDGQVDPLFNTFAVQSPAFEWAWDNSQDGRLDGIYKKFSNLAGCKAEYDIDCLRAADSSTLISANQELFEQVRKTGLFPVGPAVDGKWIKSIPAVTLSKGKHWNGIKSAIISHCENESAHFTPKHVDSEEKFDTFLNEFLPGQRLEPQRRAIKKQYDCKLTFGGDYQKCLAAIIQHASFNCNARYLFDAYPDESYMMSYGYPITQYAYHASDIIPLFASNAEQVEHLLRKTGVPGFLAQGYAEPLIAKVSPHLRQYFASLAIYGDPNKPLQRGIPDWPIADGSDDELRNVMRVWWRGLENSYFELSNDTQNLRSACSFWTKLAREIVGEKGQNTQENLGESRDEL
ncbi:hypothetical protein M431DRAFT_4098 [Trichoderma harzianum CBS 226.95]|uniref:Carboxylesterase type B domain-containing protein n=1 Tax=Trichoderma harzianum CBS 226.95 TaxID=983964 RepID=A0A2T4AIT9_TRIHA|nr:hypothetical protein M431DRAFT_4098 [Trichoderma harzianum CBS 226.95]PTB57004.1 hypothetical protein M431DRAFT_4098 [Trichoderma harzianum CBS 226.95]